MSAAAPSQVKCIQIRHSVSPWLMVQDKNMWTGMTNAYLEYVLIPVSDELLLLSGRRSPFASTCYKWLLGFLEGFYSLEISLLFSFAGGWDIQKVGAGLALVRGRSCCLTRDNLYLHHHGHSLYEFIMQALRWSKTKVRRYLLAESSGPLGSLMPLQ